MNGNQKLIYESLWTAYRTNRDQRMPFNDNLIIYTLRDVYDDFEPCIWRTDDNDFIPSLQAFLREVKA